jgi:phospholipid transport system substrate-binding protein
VTRSRSVAPAHVALWLWGAFCLLAWAPAAGASGPGPTEQLKGAIDRVLVVLEDPALKAPARAAERRRAIRRIAEEIFDFEETARLAMAQHWRALAPEQQREFVTLFTDLLEQAYMSKIEMYGGERIQYVGERVQGDYATIATRLTTKKGTEVPIDYRALRQAERWRVYDVSIEGVSLVANYRTQFNSLMRTSSPEQLLARLRSRVQQMSR